MRLGEDEILKLIKFLLKVKKFMTFTSRIEKIIDIGLLFLENKVKSGREEKTIKIIKEEIENLGKKETMTIYEKHKIKALKEILEKIEGEKEGKVEKEESPTGLFKNWKEDLEEEIPKKGEIDDFFYLGDIIQRVPDIIKDMKDVFERGETNREENKKEEDFVSPDEFYSKELEERLKKTEVVKDEMKNVEEVYEEKKEEKELSKEQKRKRKKKN